MGLTWKPRGAESSIFDGRDTTGRFYAHATNISGRWRVYLAPWAVWPRRRALTRSVPVYGCRLSRGDGPLTGRYPASRGRIRTSRFGFVDGSGVGPQADLVDHHRAHRDGVPARPGRLELLGHCPNRVEFARHLGGDLIDSGKEHPAYASVWHPGYLRVSGPGVLTAPPGHLSVVAGYLGSNPVATSGPEPVEPALSDRL
jgi:hypothetical protein